MHVEWASSALDAHSTSEAGKAAIADGIDTGA